MGDEARPKVCNDDEWKEITDMWNQECNEEMEILESGEQSGKVSCYQIVLFINLRK